MKSVLNYLAALTCGGALALAVATEVHASLLLSPSSPSPVASGTETSTAAIHAIIYPAYLDPLGSSEVYKQNVGEGFDTGAFAASYKTTFSNSSTDPSDFKIEYVSGPVLTTATHLLVKGGGPDKAGTLWWLFDISSWNGIDDIIGTGFLPDQGAISHVTIYATRDDGVIPEPTAALVWATLAGVIAPLARRRK